MSSTHGQSLIRDGKDKKVNANKDLKLCQGIFGLDIRKYFCPERGVRHWNVLPKSGVQSPVSVVFKESMGMAVGALLELPWWGWLLGWAQWLSKPIDSMILGHPSLWGQCSGWELSPACHHAHSMSRIWCGETECVLR